VTSILEFGLNDFRTQTCVHYTQACAIIYHTPVFRFAREMACTASDGALNSIYTHSLTCLLLHVQSQLNLYLFLCIFRVRWMFLLLRPCANRLYYILRFHFFPAEIKAIFFGSAACGFGCLMYIAFIYLFFILCVFIVKALSLTEVNRQCREYDFLPLLVFHNKICAYFSLLISLVYMHIAA